MFALFRFGENPFTDKQISRQELGAYTPEHLARMTADSAGGQLNAEIATTATLMDAFDSSLTGETLKGGIQKARTGAMRTFRDGLANDISKVHGAVVGVLGQNSPRMAEFFPAGREIFSKCQDNELDNKLTALRDAVQAEETANAGTFSAAILTLANALVTTWAGLYGASRTGKAQGGESADDRRAASQALRVQLYKNVLKIATIFAGQVTADGQPRGAERIAHYCPQHLLENKATPDAPNPPQG